MSSRPLLPDSRWLLATAALARIAMAGVVVGGLALAVAWALSDVV
ncbi:hypothetical protein [Ideonella sp. B508-1]|nr:hypothetical protein [Ideonella sp. B508-1]